MENLGRLHQIEEILFSYYYYCYLTLGSHSFYILYLQLQSSRLSKMETDYHSNSYQVEEMKANEGKLIKQITDLEKQKQELNELRLRDMDMQISLQDRLVRGSYHEYHYVYI